MQGTFYILLDHHGLSKDLSFPLLGSIGLKSETEEFITASQDGVSNTLIYRSSLMSLVKQDTRCRACHQPRETQLLSTCRVYAASVYISKHNAAENLKNFWQKKLWSTHEQLTLTINDVIYNPQKMPSFLRQEGTTYLIPKDQNKNRRSIKV